MYVPEIDITKLVNEFVYHQDAPLIFNSGLFLFLFFGFLTVYCLLARTHRAKVVFVVLFSLYFYYKSSGFYFILLIVSIITDFHLGNWLYRTQAKALRKILLVLSLTVNLGMLAYFKYTNFFFETYAGISGDSFQRMDIFLPIGISFFTFQSLSYTLDIYRNKLEPVSHILDYAFFVSFFPQLVAGPIVRASVFIPQIYRPAVVTREMFGRAVFLITTGLIKKGVIADYISINFVDRVFESPQLYSGLENLFGIYGYALQIYCDFSGYSDMAIGIALLLGFHFPANFNSPYRSLNITEFWRRWHISLSTWLRDYLYISLGGNRKGTFRTYVNLLITMVLGGLWHGAALRFLLWGALHGVALAVHKAWLSLTGRKAAGAPASVWSKGLSWLFTFHFVCFCWIFFRAESMEIAGQMLQQIAYRFNPQILPAFLTGYAPVLSLMALGFLFHFFPGKLKDRAREWVIRVPVPAKALILLLAIVWVVQVKSSGIQPFIYFQF